MLEMLIPTVVGAVVDIFTSNPDTVETAKQVALENKTLATAATLAVPGMFLEFVLRKIKTTNRVSVFLGIKKVVTIIKEICAVTETALEYVEKKTDVVVKQRTKDADS